MFNTPSMLTVMKNAGKLAREAIKQLERQATAQEVLANRAEVVIARLEHIDNNLKKISDDRRWNP